MIVNRSWFACRKSFWMQLTSSVEHKTICRAVQKLSAELLPIGLTADLSKLTETAVENLRKTNFSSSAK